MNKTWKRIGSIWWFFGWIIFVGGCDYFDLNNSFYEKPKDPPYMRKLDDMSQIAVDHEVIVNYQKQIVDYIDYLEQYYVSIGYYYQGDTKYPYTRNRHDECRVYDYIFNDIELPLYSGFKDVSMDYIVNELINRIKVLRGLIKENNEYMARLREHYKACYNLPSSEDNTISTVPKP